MSDILAISRLVLAGDYRALWVALIRTLPPCGDCGAPSTHTIRLHPQDQRHYLCSRNECHDRMRAENAKDPEYVAGWEPAPWIDHVVAAEIGGEMKERR